MEIIKSNTTTTVTNCPPNEIEPPATYNYTVQVEAQTNNSGIVDPTPAAPTGYVGASSTQVQSGDVTDFNPVLLDPQADPVTFSQMYPQGVYGVNYNIDATYEGSSTNPTDGAYPGDQNYNSSSGACQILVND